MQAVRAIIDPQGQILFADPVQLNTPRQVLVILLEEGATEADLQAQSALAAELLNQDTRHKEPRMYSRNEDCHYDSMF